MNFDRQKNEESPAGFSPERRNALRLIGEIENEGLKKYASEILTIVDEAIQSGNIGTLSIGSLATRLPDVVFRMLDWQDNIPSEWDDAPETDVARFRSFQKDLQALLIRKRAELRPENTRREIERLRVVIERELKRGDASTLEWLKDYLDRELNFTQRAKGYPPEKRDITDEGLAEIENMITLAHAEIAKRRATWN